MQEGFEQDRPAARRRRPRDRWQAAPEPPPAAVLRRLRVAPNGFAFDPVSGLTFTLAGSGAAVLRWLADELGIAGAAERLAAATGIDPARAELDVERFALELRCQLLPSRPR